MRKPIPTNVQPSLELNFLTTPQIFQIVENLTEKDWLILAAGLLLGIPIGIALLWFFTHSKNTTAKTYANLEEWEFIRDPITGRTKGLRVKRTAKEAA
jgi:hypothetical protein